MQSNIIGIRFQDNGKIYHFDSSKTPDIKVGDFVLVETNRGRQIGQVIQFVDSKKVTAHEELKPVERHATPRDLVLHQLWQSKEAQALNECRLRAAEMKLTNIKIISSEYSFDGKKLTFTYCSDSDEKVDLKALRSEMMKRFRDSQVEMRQIGPRDVARQFTGMGACGLSQRCCTRFLSEFSPISIKMAKEQGISLTPDEITGLCGRLRCCLLYEFDHYTEVKKELPKKGKRVITPVGEGKVTNIIPLQQIVIVSLPDLGDRQFHAAELEPWDDQEAVRRKTRVTEADSNTYRQTERKVQSGRMFFKGRRSRKSR